MTTSNKRLVGCLCVVLTATSLAGCSKSDNTNSPSTNVASNSSSAANAKSDTAPTVTGVEKQKPASGTGNVQGKVLYNDKPVENIEVKLCEKFNRFLGGCDGKTHTARTDANGEYVIADVEPKVYEGLLARVFETDSYIFAAAGIAGISSAKYDVTADKTLFVAPTNLFKGDLKLVNPKAGAKVSAENLELKWEAYPDAAYYKFSVFADTPSVTSPYINVRVEATSYGLDKPLEKGTYRWQVDAYNSADRKLAESGDNIKFTIN
ncbi:MAG TPA: hypothetical protein VK363_17070 [Pyrinomonadaceae bacterium]|nr:hypothetical protein [Pyrinomonadaceae bacterium]